MCSWFLNWRKPATEILYSTIVCRQLQIIEDFGGNQNLIRLMHKYHGVLELSCYDYTHSGDMTPL